MSATAPLKAAVPEVHRRGTVDLLPVLRGATSGAGGVRGGVRSSDSSHESSSPGLRRTCSTQRRRFGTCRTHDRGASRLRRRQGSAGGW